MNEIVGIWILTLVTIMADGTASVASIDKANRKECMANRAELIATFGKLKAEGVVKGWSIECEPVPVAGVPGPPWVLDDRRRPAD